MPTLEVNCASGDVNGMKGEALVIGVFQGDGEKGKPQAGVAACGQGVIKAVERVLKEKWMTGKVGESLTLPAMPEMGIKTGRLILMGLGAEEKVTPESLRAFGARLGKAAVGGGA